MPTFTISYAIVTIGLIAICLSLIYILVLPRLTIVSTTVVMDYQINIEKMVIAKFRSNTKIIIKNYPKDMCRVIERHLGRVVYILCNCNSISNSTIPITVCGGSTCKTFFLRCR